MSPNISDIRKLNDLIIHHYENRIDLELSNLAELENVNVSSGNLIQAKAEVRSRIRLLWVTYQKLDNVDTKTKIRFLSSNSKLIDILDVKITSQ